MFFFESFENPSTPADSREIISEKREQTKMLDGARNKIRDGMVSKKASGGQDMEEEKQGQEEEIRNQESGGKLQEVKGKSKENMERSKSKQDMATNKR